MAPLDNVVAARSLFSRTRFAVALVAALAAVMAFSAPALARSAPAPRSVSPPVHNAQSYNGTALTPPMGWNDWYQYRCTVTEDDVLANARALVSSGLAALGYDYVNLDDCWMASTRDADGDLQADPTRFPHGIAWLAGQLHAMGLKLGVYEGAGTTTCQRLPGSWGYYRQDADTFASWGVDYVKFDYCGKFPDGSTTADLEADYQQMSQDLVATGRPIVYSEELPIAAGDANPANASYLTDVAYSAQIANMWRVAPDETTNFDSTVFGHLADDLPLAQYAHPGAWNDLDMLLTGTNGYGWTAQQEQTQMSIWAEMASPLIVSTDLTSMSAATRQILGNQAVVAVDQDPLGRQGQLVAQRNGVDIVSKPLANGDVAVLLANTGSTAQQVSTTATAAGLGRAAAYSVSDLWAGTTRESAGTVTATVPAEGSVLLRVSPLRGPSVGTYAPYTNLTVSADVPAAYRGSQFDVAQPGQTISVQASLQNEGREPLRQATLSLTGPSEWRTGPPVPDSGVVTNSTPTIHASVNVAGATILELYVGEGNGTISYGNADFGSPRLTCAGSDDGPR